MPKRSSSSNRWLQRQKLDPYVDQAKRMGFVSRAVFKLEEIQNKYKIIKPGMQIVDLGAAPGGWSQLILKLVNNQGFLLAIDLLPLSNSLVNKINGIKNFKFVQGDFTDSSLQEQLIQLLPMPKLDLVVSDLAPNLTGRSEIDQANMLELADKVLIFSSNMLKPGGKLLLKLFSGSEVEDYIMKVMNSGFNKPLKIKPRASRAESKEFYLLAQKIL